MTLQEHKDWLIELLRHYEVIGDFTQVWPKREGALYFGDDISYDEYLVKYAKAIKAMEAKLTEENVV